MGEEVMRTNNRKRGTTREGIAWMVASIILLLMVLLFAHFSFGQESQPRIFPSVAEASTALFSAVKNNDEQELESILGVAKEVSSSSDEVEDRLERERFSQKYQQM